ncbi:hypothetical protein D9758_006471 [Tetrapyrgos nigripes]|uniref:Methyltransferase domain-containing protein n=1 Tax=Tetrapyrgos nigripes TaxID=182062 RepID=A0A8H5GL34_9AGAR|nr:hypothetical protein D9758_006471 [Tetrapyrgos nigripes]
MALNGANGHDPLHDDDGLVVVDDADLQSYFAVHNGRRYHTTSSPYPLPLDRPEVQRFNTEHNILRVVMNGNLCVNPLRVVQALADDGRTTKTVVDLATGNGKWMRDMAELFPHVEFYGVDIVPLAPTYYAQNVYFELEDIRTPTRWQEGTVDVVHARSAFMAVNDYRRIIQEAARILKPEGLFLAGEWQQNIALHPDTPIPPALQASYLPNLRRFFSTLHTALGRRNIISTVTMNIEGYANAYTRFFYTPVHGERFFVPIGTWSASEEGRNMGHRMQGVLRRYMDSVRPLLLGEIPEAAVDQMFAACEAEMALPGSGLGMIFATFCAVRRTGIGPD